MPFAGGVIEGLAACGFELGPGAVVGLQVQRIGDDQGEEQVVDIDAMAAEHAPRPCPAQRRQQFQAVGDEFGIKAGHGPQCRGDNLHP